jgi:hypothetical protein
MVRGSSASPSSELFILHLIILLYRYGEVPQRASAARVRVSPVIFIDTLENVPISQHTVAADACLIYAQLQVNQVSRYD